MAELWEQIASIICRVAGKNPDERDDYGVYLWQHYKDDARNAIVAMDKYVTAKQSAPPENTQFSRYVIGGKAIADCFPRSADPHGVYHLDFGNLQALVHTAIELYEKQQPAPAEDAMVEDFKTTCSYSHDDEQFGFCYSFNENAICNAIYVAQSPLRQELEQARVRIAMLVDVLKWYAQDVRLMGENTKIPFRDYHLKASDAIKAAEQQLGESND